MIVAARVKEDVTWLSVYLADIPHIVIQACVLLHWSTHIF